MAKTREDLHNCLVDILGSYNVYYQPPESVKLKYPAIVYTRDDIRNRHADNKVYSQNTFYQLTLIDKNPDSVYLEPISKLPYCRFVRHFESDNLNHDVFNIGY